MTAWLRECLEAELAAETAAANGKAAMVGGRVLDKWTQLVGAFDKLASAKVRLDKSSKALADSMTPEEETEAVRAYIRSLDPRKRQAFLEKETEYHLANQKPG